MRFAVDTGGTFTDLVVEDNAGQFHMFKAPTTPEDPIEGVIASLDVAANTFGCTRRSLLGRGTLFIHGTTHAINAIITNRTARTALITTKGHRDILGLREGGRAEPFNFTVPFPEPYVPRALTFELPGRIIVDGSERHPFDEEAALQIIRELRERQIEAVAVCLLWSIVNPIHEQRMGELLDEFLPGIPYTLSHRINPSLREYRRASSTAIDASLKPMMQSYLRSLDDRLLKNGFGGRVLIVTSLGGVMDSADIAEAPINLINSGPSMAPVAGRFFAREDEDCETAIIADTGGTTYDVSLVRAGRIPLTRETWIGEPYRGHMTGFPSVDVKSIGAGGGSVAWVDSGGLLHVGPQSAGAVPGPACYGNGGIQPTVTDAALVLGHLDPGFFLGGRMELDILAAKQALHKGVAKPLGISLESAASSVLTVATEAMVQAIADITINQGIDPASAILVGGGGAAGLNSVLIARRLGSARVIIPQIGAALSAAGAMMSDLATQVRHACFTSTDCFDFEAVNKVLTSLKIACEGFISSAGEHALESKIEFFTEARYRDQVWEIEVPVQQMQFESGKDVEALINDFHRVHEEIFAIRDERATIEVVAFVANVRCRLREPGVKFPENPKAVSSIPLKRSVYFVDNGWISANVFRLEALKTGERISGPAIVESPFTTVVVDPGAYVERRASGSLSIDPGTSSTVSA